MTRILAAAVLLLFWTSAVMAGDARRPIDLNEPGALEALQLSNPTHYTKVEKIMEGLLQRRDADVPRWIQASFDGHDVRYAPILMTSDPPKRRLSFALDATRYEVVVTLTSMRGVIVPAR